MCELHPKKVKAWADSDLILKRGVESEEVTIFELLMQSFDPDLYDGRIDDDYGKGCRSAAMRYQQYRLIEEDGRVGEITKKDMYQAYMAGWKVGKPYNFRGTDIPVLGPYHPVLGMLPHTELGKIEAGKMSSFGGPHDTGDRIYGQAYIRGGDSPAETLAMHPELVRLGILMSEEQALAVKYGRRDWKPGQYFFEGDLSKWPKTTRWDKKVRTAFTSALLNQDSYYVAMPFKKSGGKSWRNELNPLILVWDPRTGKGGVGMRSDWGPSFKRTGRTIDLSNGMCDALYLKPNDKRELPTDSYVRYAWVDRSTPLGPVQIPIT